MQQNPAPVVSLRLGEVMAALSLATDLGNGQPLEFSVRACILALRLAAGLGLTASELHDLFYYALLRHVGCNAEAYALAALVGDEMAVRREYATIDAGNLSENFNLLFRHLRLANAGSPPFTYIRQLLTGFLSGSEVVSSAVAGYCEVAQSLARRLGFGAAVGRALGQIYERWDGRGQPGGLKGEEISLVVRIVVLAQDMVIFQRLGGLEAALAVARERSGGKYDPQLVERFCRDAPQLLLDIDDELSWDRLLAMEPGPPTVLSGPQIDTVCQVIADFADLKSPNTLGHSPRVANLAAEAGRRYGLTEPEVVLLRRAGWLHEIGSAFLSAYPHMERLTMRGRQLPFAPALVAQDDGFGLSDRLFARERGDHSTASLDLERGEDGEARVTDLHSSRAELQLIKLTGSSFAHFARDEHTTLPERSDRPLYIWCDIGWRYTETADAFGADPAVYVDGEQVADVAASVFADFVSLSIQHLVHQIGTRMLDRFPQLAEVSFDAQNRLWDVGEVSGDDDRLRVYTDPRPPFGRIGLVLQR